MPVAECGRAFEFRIGVEWRGGDVAVFGQHLRHLVSQALDLAAVPVGAPRDVFERMAPYAEREAVEVFWLLALDAQHRLIGGAPDSTVVADSTSVNLFKLLGAALDQWEAEDGPFTPGELDEAASPLGLAPRSDVA